MNYHPALGMPLLFFPGQVHRAFHKYWQMAKQPTTHLSPAGYLIILIFHSIAMVLINKLLFAICVHFTTTSVCMFIVKQYINHHCPQGVCTWTPPYYCSFFFLLTGYSRASWKSPAGNSAVQ